MKPHPELVKEYPDKYCLAVPGGDYVIYLRWGGVCKLDLSDVSESSIIEYQWFDPKKAVIRNKGNTTGGGIKEFHAPDQYPGNVNIQDWVLYVKVKGA